MKPMGEGITRREALKKGLAVAGAVAWATPTVQTIGMRAAGAVEVVSNDACLGITLIETASNVFGNPNRYAYRTTVCNCGVFDLHDVDVRTEIVAVSKNGNPGALPANTNVQTTIIGLIPKPEPPAVEECEFAEFSFDIKARFAHLGLVAGDTLEYTLRSTADDGIGPVSDTETFLHEIA